MSISHILEPGSVAPLEAPHFDAVRERTPPHVNQKIDERTIADLARFVGTGPDAIGRRIAELDREWDIDRAVMALFSGVGGLNALLSLRRWLTGRRPGRSAFLLGLQFAFLFHHARAGWCPPVSVLRRLGFRTRKEIEEERSALLALLDRRETATEAVVVIATD